MPNKEDAEALAAGAGVLDHEYAVYKVHQRYQQFRKYLVGELESQGLELINVEIGREAGSGALLWSITVRHPVVGIQAMCAQFQRNTDPFSDETRHDLVKRVAAWFRKHGA